MSQSLFKVGDRIQNRGLPEGSQENSQKFGRIDQVAYERDHNWIVYDDGCTGEGSSKYYKLIKPKTFMSKVSIMMKKLLDNDAQTLVKAGYLNGDLELTVEGESALMAILFQANKAELVKVAEDKIAEEKESLK